MSIISAFCKKGGVGKTTFIGYLGQYLANKGKTVLIISVDDQNSVFKLFGADDKVFEETDNYLEFLLSRRVDLGDVLIEVRENLFLIKTLNTDKLSLNMTLERTQEKILKKIIEKYNEAFDYILIDFPPSSSRLTEILLDMSDTICIIVGLDSLGLGGFFNSIQYFVDNDIRLDGIKYIVPNGYSKTRRAPKVSLDKLIEQAKAFTPNAKVLPPLAEKSIIKNLQSIGVSVFDDVELSNYDKKAKTMLESELSALFDMIEETH